MPKGIYKHKKNQGFQKGHKPFVNWTGRKHTKETIKKMTRVHTGIPNGKLNTGKGWISSLGYKCVRLNNQTILEHHKMWCDNNGLQRIPNGFCIHHINGDRLNNNPDNLVLLNHGFHTQLHNDIRKDTN